MYGGGGGFGGGRGPGGPGGGDFGGGGGRGRGGGMRLVTPKGQMSGSNMPPAITGLPASKCQTWFVLYFDAVLVYERERKRERERAGKGRGAGRAERV